MEKLICQFKRAGLVNIIIVLVLSFLILAGWLFYDSPIKNLFPGNQLSNPVTAVCFLLAGLSFILLINKEKNFNLFGKFLAIIIVITGSIKFLEIFINSDFGIDKWLFTNKLALNSNRGKPNFMAPNTAFTFIISGLALFFFRYRIHKKNLLADYFAAISALISLVALIGFLYQSMEFYHAEKYIPMALSTAVSFFLLSLAILFSRCEFGFFKLFTGKYEGSRAARLLVPCAIIIPVGAGLLRLYGEQIGLYSPGFGVALFAITTIIIFLILIGHTALSINAAGKVHEDEMEARKKSEEQIQELNKELESFTYSVSHDLRAPLRIISGYAEMIREDNSKNLSEEAKRMLENILLNAKRMSNLIDDLLNFSRLGRKKLTTHKTDMNAVVQTVLQQYADHTKYNLTVNHLPPCICDSNLMKQVWENLISNAVKYSANKPDPVIELGATGENNKTVYYIADNGAGFDMKYYDKLFGVFQRLHNTAAFEGTGVGLALTQRIIAKHGGKIWAESKINEGTTFYFTVC